MIISAIIYIGSSNGQTSISAQLNSIAQQVNIQMTNTAVLNSIAAQCKAPAVLVAEATAAAITASTPSNLPSTTTQNVNNLPSNTTTSIGVLDSGSSINLTENQKKLLGLTGNDDTTITLEQQVELTLKGKEQRLILMKKLMSRQTESRVVVLKNMVGPEDVDEDLETEITGK